MQSQNAIEHAQKSLEQNDKSGALAILKKVVQQEPRNAAAWLLLSETVEKEEQAAQCLRNVLKLDPDNQEAQIKLARYQSPSPSGRQSPAPASPDILRRDQTRPQVIVKNTGQPENQAIGTYRRKKGFWDDFLNAALIVAVITVVGLVILAVSGSSIFEGQSADETAQLAENVTNVIIENIRASNAEDFDRYMATIHTKSPGYDDTKEMLATAFGDYDLSYKVSNLEVLELNKNKAVVAFTLTTTKIKGPAFRNNRITGEMVLRIEDGHWKIYDQTIDDVEYFD